MTALRAGVGAMSTLLVALIATGCARRATYTDEDDSRAMAIEASEPAPPMEAPTDGGPLVRIARVEARQPASLHLSPRGGEEIFVVVERGSVGESFGWRPGAVARVQRGMTTTAMPGDAYLVAFVRHPRAPFGEPSPLAPIDGEWGTVVHADDVPVLPGAGGKLRVRIFHDAQAGARYGAISHLDADADLDVPVHVHPDSVEALFVESGDGTMILGERRFTLVPGAIVYVPAGVEHGYEHGTAALSAWQIYAPPGPEQRFRESTPANARP